MPGTIWRHRAEWVAALSGAVAMVVVAGPSFRRGFPLDDAWTHMVYGLSLRREGVMAYNTGTPSTGCTSPVWVFFTAFAHLVTGATTPSTAAVKAVKVMGGVLHVTCAVLAASVGRACATRRRYREIAAFGAGVLVAACPMLAFAAASGMEVPLAAALLLGAFLAASAGRFRTAGFLAGVATAARPECGLAIPFVIVLGVLRGPRPHWWRGASQALALFAVAPLLVATRNLFASGRPLPATFYVKTGHRLFGVGESLRRGFDGILGSFRPASLIPFRVFVVFALVAGAWALVRSLRGPFRGTRSVLPRLLGGSLAFVAVLYVIASSLMVPAIHPSVFYHQRYLLPVVPLLAVAAVAGAVWVAEVSPRVANTNVVLVTLAGAFAACVVLEVFDWPERRARLDSDGRNIDELQVAIGRYIARHSPPDAVVWTVDAGAVRYWGQRRTLDLVGLNTLDQTSRGFQPRSWWPDYIVVMAAGTETGSGRHLLRLAGRAVSRHYTVTLEPHMAEQLIFRCAPVLPPDAENFISVAAAPTWHKVMGRCKTVP